MTANRFYIPGPLRAGGLADLPVDDVHHVRNVLRYQVGDSLFVFDGLGAEFAAEIVEISKRAVTVKLGPPLEGTVESPLTIRLFVALVREQAWDEVLQLATQLGVTMIQPLSTARTARVRTELPVSRWERILRAAAKQAGRRQMPTLLPLIPLPMIPAPAAGVRPVRLLLAPDHPCHLPVKIAPAVADIAVGPEGGFTPEELQILAAKDFLPLGLGPRILRVETACAAAMVLVQYTYGDLADAQRAERG